MARDSDTDPPESSSPLSDLADRINRTQSTPASDTVWEKFEDFEYVDDPELWEHLTKHRTDVAIDDHFQPASLMHQHINRYTTNVLGVSTFGQIVHGYITAIVFLFAILIVLTAGTDVISNQYWILSLPLFALGFILLIPVLAWELDFWDPGELG